MTEIRGNYDELFKYIKKNRLEYQALLLLLFNNTSFFFSPIDGPRFNVNKTYDNSISFSVLDNDGINILSSDYQLPSLLVSFDEQMKGAQKYFSHPENLFGYQIRMNNLCKSEIVYSRSKNEGIDKTINLALIEYFENRNINSISDLDQVIYMALQETKFYAFQNERLDYVGDRFINCLLSDAVFKSMKSFVGDDLPKVKQLLEHRIRNNLQKICKNRYISKPTESFFNGEDFVSSWSISQEFIPMPTIKTSLNEKVTIIDRSDEIPSILYKIALKIRANKIRIATGYAYDSGLEMIWPTLYAVKVAGGTNEIIIGDLRNYSDETHQKCMNRNTADKINLLCKTGIIRNIMTYPESFYHGKFYYISNDKTTYVITGSSNVTSTAYRTNRELDVLYRFDGEEPLLKTFEDWYDELKSQCTSFLSLRADLFESNLRKDDTGEKHGSSFYRQLTSEEEKERYRLLEDCRPTRIDFHLFDRRRDFRAFSKYVAFVFEEKNISIIESFSYGNASYVFSSADTKIIQEELFRKSKEQVQNSGIFVTCITHDDLYEEVVRSFFI